MSTGIGFMGELTATFSEAIVPLGTIRRTDGDGKAYIFCKAATTCGAITAGQALYQLTGQAYGNVTEDVANSNTNAFVGIAMAAQDAADGLYCWAQFDGIYSAKTTTTDTAFVIGDLLYGSATGVFSKIQATGGAAIIYLPLAVVIAAKATAGATCAIKLL
jgi:hypothetical protein